MIRTIVGSALLAVALLGPWLALVLGIAVPTDSFGLPYETPSTQATLGTDHLGRSVLAAVMHGGQRLVLTAILAGTLTTAFGTLLGCLSAVHPRVGFVVDALADATILIPSVIVLLLIAALYPSAGLGLLVFVTGCVGAPYAARVVAAAAFPVARTGYVQAARGTGASTWSLMIHDIIPNISTVLRSVWALRIVEALYMLAVASFLGVGASLGEFAWSAMVRDNVGGIFLNPWAVMAPAAMLAFTSIAVMAVLHSRKLS